MYEGNDVAIAGIFGLFFGFIGMMFLAGVTTENINEYPGLSERLTELQDDCESRPGVISCEWSEDKVDFVPKDATR